MNFIGKTVIARISIQLGQERWRKKKKKTKGHNSIQQYAGVG